MFQIISLLCGLGSLVCLIIVVIPLFKEKGALHGILGILCGLYTFIWGWINATRLNLKNVMLIWSVFMAGSIIFNMMAAAKAVSAIQAGKPPITQPANP